MPLRYLFGPVTTEFANQKLPKAVAEGRCLPFSHLGAPLTIGATDQWSDVSQRFPADWLPDAIVLWLDRTTVPNCLWTAPIPIIGIAGDWSLLFHYDRLRLPLCDVVATGAGGVDVLRRAGIGHVRRLEVAACGHDVREEFAIEETRDIDIGVVGNFRESVHLKRLPSIARLATAGGRWRVAIRQSQNGQEDRRFFRRVRIAFNDNALGECDHSVFEAANAGALVFVKRPENPHALPFEDRRECIDYGIDDLDALLEYYLTHEEERAAIAAAGQRRAREDTFESHWERFLADLDSEWPDIRARAAKRRPLDAAFDLAARTWQAINAVSGADPNLAIDLQRAAQSEHRVQAALHQGLLRWVESRNLGQSPSPRSLLPVRAFFEIALAEDADHPVALLWLADVLVRLGELDPAVALARRGLAVLSRSDSLRPEALSLPSYPPELDDFRVQWEEAAWKNAGDATAEIAAKRALLRSRLHSILAALTKDLSHFHEAVLANPHSAALRTALGCALATVGRTAEAVVHLQVAANVNPFDGAAARALHQALLEIGAASDAERTAAGRRLLAAAAPELIAPEPWYAPPSVSEPHREEWDPARPRLSLCMIVKNEEHNLGDCLRSAADIADEIVIVDTGSTDATKDIAASFGAKIVNFPWIDSFSAARNESLRHASGAWLFWLDADDRLDEDNRAKLFRLKASLTADNVAYAMKCRCLAQQGSHDSTVVDHIRLFRNLPGLRWEHRIHEQILPSLRLHGAVVSWTDIVVTHVGYVDRATVRRKQERDLRLLLLEREELNDHPFTLFNLGSTYLELGLSKSALPVLQRSLERSAPGDSITRKLYVLISQTFRKLSRPAEALDVCAAGRRHFPFNAELLFQEANVRDDIGDWAGARRCLETALQTPEEQHFASVSEGLAGPHLRLFLGQLWAKEGRPDQAERVFREAIVHTPVWIPLWIELGQLLLKEQRWTALEDLSAGMEQTLGPTMESRVLSARAAMARGAFPQAIDTLRATIEQYPSAVWPRVILSHALLQQGTDLRAAEPALKAVLELDPTNQEAARNLSVLRSMLAQQSPRR